MRLMVFFDLPVSTAEQRRRAGQFRRFLKIDGYDLIQWSVYGRVINGMDAVEKHLNRLAHNLPPEGSVRALQLTEKQFSSMQILVGERRPQEKNVDARQLLLF
jgi:CRISPR-associated protein Cas2